MVCAYGVEDIVTEARSIHPRYAGEVFPVIRAFIPWMSMGGVPVDLLIGWISHNGYPDMWRIHGSRMTTCIL